MRVQFRFNRSMAIDPNAVYHQRSFSHQHNSTMLEPQAYNSMLNGSQPQTYDYHMQQQQQHQQQQSSIGQYISNRNHYVPSEYSETTRC